MERFQLAVLLCTLPQPEVLRQHSTTSMQRGVIVAQLQGGHVAGQGTTQCVVESAASGVYAVVDLGRRCCARARTAAAALCVTGAQALRLVLQRGSLCQQRIELISLAGLQAASATTSSEICAACGSSMASADGMTLDTALWW